MIYATLALWLACLACPAQDDNRCWDRRFFLPGVQGKVRAIAISGTDLYVGGAFTSVDSVPATNIARWNGTVWSALGAGVGGEVCAIAVTGGAVYAGGTFTNAGGVAAHRVAKWDGSSWTALGNGVSGGSVDALAVGPDGALFMGGSFDFIGGLGATNLARWDGATWTQLGGGVDSTLYQPSVAALAFLGSDLYVGGLFTSAGGINAGHIAKWNGASWSAMAGGVDDRDYPAQVTALAVMDGHLYVGGSFSSAGPVSAHSVARWNGSSWSALGDGLDRFFGALPATALAAAGGRVVVGGHFESDGDVTAENLAVWDGSVWSELGGGATGAVLALGASGTDIYVGGSFTTQTSGLTSLALAHWNGSQWRNLTSGGGEGFYGPRTCLLTGCQGDEVSALAMGAGTLYAAGGFTVASSLSSRNVARWDGMKWRPLGNGLEGHVHALTFLGETLYAGGRFGLPGGMTVSNLAQWNGANWSGVGGMINGPVYAMAGMGGALYAGGQFTTAGGVSATNLARWNGSGWSALGAGLNGPVHALAVSDNHLYVGGKFTSAGGVTASNVASWNGSAWSALGGGVGGVLNTIARIRPPPVSALAVQGGHLYAAGDFIWAGGVAATNIARWNGTQWSALGLGIVGPNSLYPPPTIRALSLVGGELYVGGTFQSAGGLSARHIARWNGVRWSALGEGIGLGVNSQPAVQALAANGSELYVAGHFKFAGGHPASDFSIWHLPAALSIARWGEGVRLSWAGSASNYSVLHTEHLSPPLWLGLTNPVIVVDGLNTVDDDPGNRSRFYRLVQEWP